MTKHIAVLKGGWSAEREVSLNSGSACAKALRELGYKVTEIDVQPDIAEIIKQTNPDIVFNALHGKIGEDGCVQGLLEIMKIPYTHSGVMSSSVAMDKPLAKVVFAAAGLKAPIGKLATTKEIMAADPMPRPFVVKPANEGSSVGVHIIKNGDNGSWAQGEKPETVWLVEEYISGREITVAVLNGKALGVTEIRPKTGFYDYENKYTDGKTEHLCPAPLSDGESKKVMEMAEIAHESLGCRGLTRSDFRYDGKNFYILEINTQPGMTSLSLSPEIAAHAGISFNQLVEKLIEAASCG